MIFFQIDETEWVTWNTCRSCLLCLRTIYTWLSVLNVSCAGFNILFYRVYFRPILFFHMGVSKNNGTPKSSILIGFSLINHPFWGTTIFGNIHMFESNAFERWKRNTQKPLQGKQFRPLESTRFKDLWFCHSRCFVTPRFVVTPSVFRFSGFFL